MLIQTQMVPMKSYLKYLSSSQHVAHQICNVTNHADVRSSRSDLWTTGLTRGVATSGVPLITPRLDDSILQNVEFHHYNIFSKLFKTCAGPHCDRWSTWWKIGEGERRGFLRIAIHGWSSQSWWPTKSGGSSNCPSGPGHLGVDWQQQTQSSLAEDSHFTITTTGFSIWVNLKLKFSIGSIWIHTCGCHSTKLCWKCTDSFRSQSSCS